MLNDVLNKLEYLFRLQFLGWVDLHGLEVEGVEDGGSEGYDGRHHGDVLGAVLKWRSADDVPQGAWLRLLAAHAVKIEVTLVVVVRTEVFTLL